MQDLFHDNQELFHDIQQKVKEGARFCINFENRSLRVNGKYVIQNGKSKSQYPVKNILCEGDIPGLESWYHSYQHSVPSERSKSHRKTYFQALDEKDLSDDDMMFGRHREEERFILEYAILSGIITGNFTWEHFKYDNPKTDWFWQSLEYPSFIILKKWITNN